MSKSISELIKEAENQFIELKEQFSEGVLKTISAFANTSGGVILIGVKDNKEVVGINLKVGEFEEIVNKIVDSLGFQPEIKLVSFNRKKLIRIDVQKSSIPIKYKGIYYKRVGNTTRGMNTDELQWDPLIANIFYTAGIIESLGSGIDRMRSALKEQNLPEMKIEANHFDFNLWFLKDVYTKEYLTKLGLNERQIKAVMYVKKSGKITNKEYQELTKISRQTATIDLSELTEKSIFIKIGKAGRGIAYELPKLTNN